MRNILCKRLSVHYIQYNICVYKANVVLLPFRFLQFFLPLVFEPRHDFVTFVFWLQVQQIIGDEVTTVPSQQQAADTAATTHSRYRSLFVRCNVVDIMLNGSLVVNYLTCFLLLMEPAFTLSFSGVKVKTNSINRLTS